MWERMIGGDEVDNFEDMYPTGDGGFIGIGTTNSINTGYVTGHHGGTEDYWVVKMAADGKLQWQKCIGSNMPDYGRSVIQTSDGGYMLLGFTSAGTVGGLPTHGLTDIVATKLSANGNIQWEKAFGGSNTEYAYCVRQTSDGGYIISGSTSSSDGDVPTNPATNRLRPWLIKTNATGAIQWQKTYTNEYAQKIELINDGYITAGGNTLAKISLTGLLQWSRAFTDVDFIRGLIRTADGGYVITGDVDDRITGPNRLKDCVVIKTDTAGVAVWTKLIGGSAQDEGWGIVNAGDGGYLVAARSGSADMDVTGNKGAIDYWLIKMAANGNIEWNKCFGGNGSDNMVSICNAKDGNVFVCGTSVTSRNGDVQTDTLNGDWDWWMAKISNPTGIESTPMQVQDIKLYPNPVIGNELTIESPTIAQLSISDITGKMLLSITSMAEGRHTIPAPALPGIYMLRAQLADGTLINRKIIRQ
jgi:hypothetical protein